MTAKYRLLKVILTMLAIFSVILVVPYFILSFKQIMAFKSDNLLTFIITMCMNLFLLLIEMVVTIYGLYFLQAGIKALDYHITVDSQQATVMPADKKKLPRVTILIPVRNKNPNDLELTLASLTKQEYPKELLQIIISSNSSNSKYVKEYKRLCKAYSSQYVSVPPDERGFKARVLNEGLKHAVGEYMIILDADHEATPRMTSTFVEAFLKLPPNVRREVAYIQAKASFKPTTTFYQKASSILLTHFYEIFEKAKHRSGTVIFNGSTACFQVKALHHAKGFPMDTYTEDSDASVRLLVMGYHGLFLDEVLSRGNTPESFQNQISQLWRWTHGAGSIFRLRTKAIIKSKNLSIFQKIDLLLSVSILFAAIGAVGIPIGITAMVAFDVPILRPIFVNHGTLVLLPASIVMIGHSLTALLAIHWESSSMEGRTTMKFIRRLVDLAVYYFLSLASFFFIIGAFVKGLTLRSKASGLDAKWNRNLNPWPPLAVLFLVCVLSVLATWKILVMRLVPYYPLVTLFLTFPFAMLMICIDIRR